MNHPRLVLLLIAALVLAIALFVPGCMHALRDPVENHYVQAQVMADACRGQTEQLDYFEAPCSSDLQSDLDSLALQARCLLDIVSGRTCRAD